MKIIFDWPPNIDEIQKVFPVLDKVVFTYGNTLYNPHKEPISVFLLKHEEAHSIRQGGNPKEWWERYLTDKEFRLAQELEAYQIQYREAEKFIKDRNELYRYLRKLAGDLSGMYGLDLTFGLAMEKIKSVL